MCSTCMQMWYARTHSRTVNVCECSPRPVATVWAVAVRGWSPRPADHRSRAGLIHPSLAGHRAVSAFPRPRLPLEPRLRTSARFPSILERFILSRLRMASGLPTNHDLSHVPACARCLMWAACMVPQLPHELCESAVLCRVKQNYSNA